MMRCGAGNRKLGYSADVTITGKEMRMRRVGAILAIAIAVLLPASDGHVRAQTPAAPFVIVQAVDELWLPIPGAEVELRERRGARSARTATTDRDGFASFRFQARDDQQSYDISVTMAGFKTAEMKNVRFGSCSGDCPSSRHVQLRLTVAGPPITIR